MYLGKFFQSFFCSFEFLFSVLDFKDQTVQLLFVLVFTLFTEKKSKVSTLTWRKIVLNYDCISLERKRNNRQKTNKLGW